MVLDGSWCSFAAIQGGLVVGVLLDAAATAVAEAKTSTSSSVAVRSVTAHLVGPVQPEVDIEIAVRRDRVGATGSTRSELRQNGHLRALAQVLTVTGSDRGQPAIQALSPTGSGSESAVVGAGEPFELPIAYVPFTQHLQYRVLGGTYPDGSGAEPRLHAWVRVTTVLPAIVQLGVLFDALPPSVFAVQPPTALPTVELTAHLHAEPPLPGSWVCIDQRTAWIANDVLVDEATMRDEVGELIGVVRQTRRIPIRRRQ